MDKLVVTQKSNIIDVKCFDIDEETETEKDNIDATTTVTEKDDFFEKIRKIMNDAYFKNYFKQYFKDMSDTKVSLMFMHTYVFIEEEFFNKYKKNLSSHDTIKILKKMFYNPDIRKIMIDSLNNFVAHDISYKETYIKAINDYVDESKLLMV